MIAWRLKPIEIARRTRTSLKGAWSMRIEMCQIDAPDWLSRWKTVRSGEDLTN